MLLSTEEETYYGLNEVGAKVWSLLPPVHQTLDSLCAALGKSYPDVSPSILREDVTALLEDLLQNRLVIRA